MATHTVVEGENLTKIGRNFGFTLTEMKNANPGINFDVLRIGQVINLPSNNQQPQNGTPTRQVMSYHVVVNEMGVPVRGSQGVTVDKGGIGVYNVTLPENVSGFVWQATLGAPDGQPQEAGSVTTQQGMGGATRVVQVRTFAAGAAAADRNFHLSVLRP